MDDHQVSIKVSRDCERWPLSSVEIAKIVVSQALVVTGWAGTYPTEVSVSLVDDDVIYALNKSWRKLAKATDVLSFPQYSRAELVFFDEAGLRSNLLLGDVVISLDTTRRQADDQQKTWQARFVELLVHGSLHLLGYDHEDGANMAEEMYNMEDKILQQFTGNFWVHL